MWTEAQKQAIENKGKNILVSAAAGSGKTAVLTERILRKLVSGETQADRLVVVTFTKAAAAEMRERIRKGLESIYKQDPSNKALFVQMTLLADADICTIDSFCNKIVRSNFREAGIDPSYRIAESAELSLIRTDVFEKVIEEFYREGGEDFFEFVSAFSSAKNDAEIEKIINAVYDESQDRPWPDEWLDGCVDRAIVKDPEESPVLKKYLRSIKGRIEEYVRVVRLALDKIYEGSGIEKYKPFMEEEISAVEEILKCEGPYEMYKLISGLEFKRFPSASKDHDKELKELCKGLRDSYKEYLNSLAPHSDGPETDSEDDFYLGGRISQGDAAYIGRQTELIVRITKRYAKALDEEKKRRNIATFSDIEHMALNILTERKDGKTLPANAALELRELYDEILTDEFQDSNELQDEILSAISDGNNRYMVGDVKQSIYRFRGGDPSIFLGKYNDYGKESDKSGELIILQNNFRSREGVLNGCNAIFSAVMNRDYTGISYDESERLVPAMEFEDFKKPELTFAGENGKVSCEVIICNRDELREKPYLEAARIAETIKGLFAEGKKVYDAKTKTYRDISYRDIVVLCHKTDTGAKIAETLNLADIPAFSESKSSYTDTYEIRPLISLMKLIDNPLDDVEFTAVLMSFFGGFKPEEIALMRSEDREEFFYRGLVTFAQNEEGEGNEELKERAGKFLKFLSDIREESAHLSVYDLLWKIIYETGYYSYVGSIPGSKRRLANIDLLLSRAFLYTGTSYNGLFQFLRYLEKLEKSDEVKSEISAVSELQDVVRIMTIHKSKGLEFPVVFLAGMGMNVNLRDTYDSEKLIISDDTVITDVYDNKRRVKRVTAFKRSLQEALKRESISEELRLLYVAMTRAVEKLYIIGSYGSSNENALEKAGGDAYIYKATGHYGFHDLDDAHIFFKMFLPVIINEYNRGSGLFELISTDSENISDIEEGVFDYTAKEESGKKSEPDEVEERYLSFVYPYENEIYMKPKVTVTELKRRAYEDEAESALDYRTEYEKKEVAEEYESFKSFTELSETAAGRGTLYHKLLEHIDLSVCKDEAQVSAQINELIASGVIPPEVKQAVKPKDISMLAASDIGLRAAEALKKDKGRREQQFMMGVEEENRSDELLVQGVIDLWFEEDDGLVVVDYKTDKAFGKGGAELLKKIYGMQLDMYAQALEKATGKKVKERIIYSFELGESITF